MKRFTETQKWEDPWFRKLPPEMKLLWQWILDRCDSAGVINPDLELASFQIGYQYPLDTLSKFGERVIAIKDGKFFIPKFIEFQYGKLSEDCRAHGPAFMSLKKHGLEGYAKGIHTLQVKEKDTVKDEEKETDSKPPKKSKATLDETKAFAESIDLPASDGEACFHKWEGNGWTNNGKPIKDWRATIRAWKSQGFLPSQRMQQPQLPHQRPKHSNGYNEQIKLPPAL